MSTLDLGIHEMPSHEYHADDFGPSLSASIAHKLVTQTPLHAWTAHPALNPDHEREEKSQFDVGTVVHSLLLEQDDSKIVVVDAGNWMTKAAKAERDEARENGKVPLLAKDWNRVDQMVTSIREQIDARQDDPPLFTDGKPEQTLIWKDSGVLCRARLDWLRDDYRTIDDAKSTAKTANPIQWSRSTLWQIGADIQVAFYLRGLKSVTGVDAQFRYLLAETTPPYAISVVSLDPSALELGQAKVDRALAKWRECLRTGEWPAYPQATYWAEAPAWQIEAWMQQDAEAMNA